MTWFLIVLILLLDMVNYFTLSTLALDISASFLPVNRATCENVKGFKGVF